MTFNEELDLILIEGYRTRKEVMDCSDRTIQANAARNSAWGQITAEVNSVSNVKKSKEQVIARYKYLNKKARRRNIDKKKHVKGTGGGPAMKLDPISEALIETNDKDPTYSGLQGAIESGLETEAGDSTEPVQEPRTSEEIIEGELLYIYMFIEEIRLNKMSYDSLIKVKFFAVNFK